MTNNLLRAKMALSRKVNGESDFTLTEVRKLCHVLRIADPVRVFDLSIDNSGGI